MYLYRVTYREPATGITHASPPTTHDRAIRFGLAMASEGFENVRMIDAELYDQGIR